jgi:hypothetical protein
VFWHGTLLTAPWLETYRGNARKVELSSHVRRHIQDAPDNERTAIVDANDDRSAVSVIGHSNHCAKRERAVGSGQVGRLNSLAARSSLPFKRID